MLRRGHSGYPNVTSKPSNVLVCIFKFLYKSFSLDREVDVTWIRQLSDTLTKSDYLGFVRYFT